MTNGQEPATLLSLLLKNEKEAADRMYLRQPRAGIWYQYTWGEVMLKARKVAAFIHNLGLKRGSHVAIISKNCAEWFIADYGILLAGMVSVPLFANQHLESIHHVLEHGDVELVFVGKLDDHKHVRDYIPKKYTTISFDYHDHLQVDHHWSKVMSTQPLVDIIEPDLDDLYTIIYSSGTASLPRGAMYTHQTIANYLDLFSKDLPRIRDLEHYKLISYLPLAHVYERSAVQLSSVVINCDVSFLESLDKFTQTLQEVQPTLFTAVPRIWSVFQQRIEQKLPAKKLNLLLKIPILSNMIKKKIRNNLGFNSCTNVFSGASFLPISIIEFFDKLGIYIQDGYGQTENLAYVTVSLLEDRRLGFVGKPRLGVEIKLGEESELLVKSPCLMTGYYKDEQATKAAFNAEGWLRTGDIAEIDAQNRLRIMGRLSENFKNQTGEFVAPSPIEKRFSNCPIIDQLCLIGRGLSSNVLLIILNDEGRLTKNKDETKSLLLEKLHEVNTDLLKHERVSHIIIIKRAWTTANDFLTPTLKVKRRMVEGHYAGLIQKTLAQNEKVIWED